MTDSKPNPESQKSNTNSVQCAGVNLGFGWTKIAVENTLLLWPSVVSEYRGGLQSNRQVEPHMLVSVGSQFYEVGEGAAKFGTPLKALHRSFAQSDVYKAMVQAALQRLAERGSHWSVVVGVALNHYRDAAVREGVRKLWEGEGGYHQLSNGKSLRVSNVLVIPETFGAASELMADDERAEVWMQSKVMIVDFGRFTTGWVPYVNGQPSGDTDSVDVGVSLLVQRLAEKLRAITGVPSLTEEEVELAMIGKRTLYGRAVEGKRLPVDVAPWFAKAVDEAWPQIEAQLRSKLGDLRGLDMVAVGGGAKAFESKLRAAFKETNLLIPDNAQDINATGMLRIAKMQTASSATV